ncbi:MAG: hydroxyacid dehydrogenase [Pseudomonadota bacterium]
MKILISDAFDPGLSDKLKQFGDVTDDKGELSTANVVLVRSKTKCTREYIDSAPNLKIIIRGGVGLDNVDKEYAKQKGIEVYNTPTASAVAVAELAFALMLSIPNRIIEGNNSMHEKKWLKKELKRTELMGKTLGLIGLGNIATEVAKRAKAFGMNVIAFRKSGKPSEYADVKKSLEEVLKASDYISLHTPLTDETKGMINKKSIALMKDKAVLINAGRGKCIVESDVVEALKSGKLSCYATDVYESDPPPESSPLYDAPNVIMTPHIGSSSKENLLRIGDCVLEILEKCLSA